MAERMIESGKELGRLKFDGEIVFLSADRTGYAVILNGEAVEYWPCSDTFRLPVKIIQPPDVKAIRKVQQALESAQAKVDRLRRWLDLARAKREAGA